MPRRGADAPAAGAPAAVARLSWEQVCARRLRRQGLDAPWPDAGPADVAGALGGVHAQVMAAAEVSVCIRLAGAGRDAVRDALWRERTLVKTRGPRGTVHLLASVDLPLWTGALGAVSAAGGQAPGAGLTRAQADAVVAAIGDALEDAADLTADELTAAIVRRTGAWAAEPAMDAFQGKWPRWMGAMHAASNAGAMCFGPNRGRRVTFTSPRRWLPGFRPEPGEAAVAEVLRRYLRAFGPATPAHFARWLAAPPKWASALFASLGDTLQPVDVEGEPGWVVAGDTEAPPDPPRGVRLLPYFDAYAVGCFPRERLFPGRAYARALARGQAGNYPVLLIDGVVAGVWHQRRAGKTIEFTVEPFGRLSAAQGRELEDQVQRVGGLLEGTPRLTVGQVTAGAHA